jgi:acyl-CoA synthetase (AMP-forming)/AMP-acid ligase II
MNLFQLLESSAQRYPCRGAVYVGKDRLHTFAELRLRALCLASAFKERTQPGDRIAIVAANCPEYIEVMFAAWAAGLVIVPLNCKLHLLEMIRIIEDAQPALTVCSRNVSRSLATAIDNKNLVIIASERYSTLLEAVPAVPVEVSPSDLAWLFFTSGTTGRSKGAMLTHRNLQAMTIAHLADFENLSVDDSIIHGAPMSHGSGLYILPYIARGARQVVPASGGYDPLEFLGLCDCHPGCGAFLAPTMLKRLRVGLQSCGQRPHNLRNIVYGGGPMYLGELKLALDVFGPIFCQLYGQGEAPMTITGLCRADHATGSDDVLASVGWPRSGTEVRVIGADGQTLPVGETGEIVCRGDVVMAGYWNQPTATAETIRSGWLRTGDMGSFDADGKLSLRDRSKDVIISGGSNIYPREVEEVLTRYPGIAEVAVIGVVDEEWGESVVAFIVCDACRPPTQAQLDAHCLGHIARFKRPKRYVFVDSLPKNEYGKVVKRDLVSSLAASDNDAADCDR